MTMHPAPVPGRAPAPLMALVLVLASAVSVLLGVQPPQARGAEEEPSRALSAAELRWGLNPESAGMKTFAGHNLFTAGDVSAILDGPGQALTAAGWKSAEGSVRIEKSPGTPATWKDVTPSGSRSAGVEMVFSGGTGTVDPSTGTAAVTWAGTASVIYYSGQSFFTISDPVLAVSATGAQITATLNGVESAQGSTDWTTLAEEKGVVIADIPRGDITLESNGFSVVPAYSKVRYPDAGQAENEYFGSFPKPFVDYLSQVGIGPYWYSTGGPADRRKMPLPVTVRWDAADRPPAGGGGSQGALGQVLDDTVRDILRAAGTDVSNTAAAWMDEAWKPLQPGAVTAAQQAGAGEAPGDAGDSGEDPADAAQEEHYAQRYASPQTGAAAPMTAGTVAGAIAPGPASPAPGAATPASDRGMAPSAAALPVTDVVYAQTSASREAGNPTHQWQWWAGAALLALAAVLFYQTVRRRDSM